MDENGKIVAHVVVVLKVVEVEVEVVAVVVVVVEVVAAGVEVALCRATCQKHMFQNVPNILDTFCRSFFRLLPVAN